MYTFWLVAANMHQHHPLLVNARIDLFQWFARGWFLQAVLNCCNVIMQSPDVTTSVCHESFVFIDDDNFDDCWYDWPIFWIYGVIFAFFFVCVCVGVCSFICVFLLRFLTQ